MIDTSKYINYTYQDFETGIKRIADYITNSEWAPDIIVGVVRGGTIPAVYLSHRLRKPVLLVHHSTIDNACHTDYNVWIPQELENGKNILLVEDIVDSGKTLSDIIQSWKLAVKNPETLNSKVKIAALVTNISQPNKVDFFDYRIDRKIEERWVIFPWE